jgi:ABC-2 type transport system ATP-binding protein
VSDSAAIVVDNVSKRFKLYRERNQSLKATIMRRRRVLYDEFWALRDVSFEIPRGSTFGLIGANGSGKSTLLKCIARILEPEVGTIAVDGTMSALLELGSGFHPELSGRDNIYLNGSILGMKKKEIQQKFDEIVDFAGVGQFIDQPVKNYSSGMYVRLGFSIAINVNPDILLVDEVLAVGDAIFQEKCMAKFAEFRQAGKTVVIVSHAMGSLRSMCDQAAWLSGGTLRRVGPAKALVDEYVDDMHIEHQESAGDGSRWGSGEILIDAVQVLDASGVETSKLHPSDPLTLRVHFSSRTLVPRPMFSLALETVEGVCAWKSNSQEAGLVLETLDGTGTVDLHVPHFALQAGRYHLSASVSDETETSVYDFHRQIGTVDVLSRAPADSGGIAHMSATWGNLQVVTVDRSPARPLFPASPQL